MLSSTHVVAEDRVGRPSDMPADEGKDAAGSAATDGMAETGTNGLIASEESIDPVPTVDKGGRGGGLQCVENADSSRRSARNMQQPSLDDEQKGSFEPDGNSALVGEPLEANEQKKPTGRGNARKRTRTSETTTVSSESTRRQHSTRKASTEKLVVEADQLDGTTKESIEGSTDPLAEEKAPATEERQEIDAEATLDCSEDEVQNSARKGKKSQDDGKGGSKAVAKCSRRSERKNSGKPPAHAPAEDLADDGKEAEPNGSGATAAPDTSCGVQDGDAHAKDGDTAAGEAPAPAASDPQDEVQPKQEEPGPGRSRRQRVVKDDGAAGKEAAGLDEGLGGIDSRRRASKRRRGDEDAVLPSAEVTSAGAVAEEVQVEAQDDGQRKGRKKLKRGVKAEEKELVVHDPALQEKVDQPALEETMESTAEDDATVEGQPKKEGAEHGVVEEDPKMSEEDEAAAVSAEDEVHSGAEKAVEDQSEVNGLKEDVGMGEEGGDEEEEGDEEDEEALREEEERREREKEEKRKEREAKEERKRAERKLREEKREREREERRERERQKELEREERERKRREPPRWLLETSSEEITEDEHEWLPSFFGIRKGKKKGKEAAADLDEQHRVTYLLVRRQLVELWQKLRPCYLPKTRCVGLKGDVRVIGRVHSYLENIGAINQGCPETAVRPDRDHGGDRGKNSHSKTNTRDPNPKSSRTKEKAENENAEEGQRDEDRPQAKEEAAFEALLDWERRKRRNPLRTEACLAMNAAAPDTAPAGYGGGASVFCLMMSIPEINQRVRVMEALQQQQAVTKKQNQRRYEMNANRVGEVKRKRDDDGDGDGEMQAPHDIIPALDHATLKKYRRQFRLDMPLQAPKEDLAKVVVSHFMENRVPSEQVTLSKFIEMVKKRKENGAGAMINTIETKRAMQRALKEEEEEEELVEEEEEEEDVFTIKQNGVPIEFVVGAKVEVLYDDQEWYPGEICSYTETTGKFRFKLTEGSNTRFAEWLPNDDIRLVGCKEIKDPSEANPNAITPGGPPVKTKLEQEVDAEQKADGK